jgi:hypothetical protein
MKILREAVEVSGEGLESLMGERVTLFCMNYIYTGKLVGVNAMCVKLENPAIVYETGAFDEKNWKDAQKLPNTMYVQIGAIESFGIVK